MLAVRLRANALADFGPRVSETNNWTWSTGCLVGAGAPFIGLASLNFDDLRPVLNIKGLEAHAGDVVAANNDALAPFPPSSKTGDFARWGFS